MAKCLFRTACVSLAMAVLAGIPAYGAGWQQDDRGWKWQQDDQTVLKARWAWLDGNQDGISECYYFDGDGYLVTGTTTPDGCTVNAQGAWVADGVVQTKETAENAGASAAGSGLIQGSMKTQQWINMKYYLYVPKDAKEDMPLIVYLHSSVPRGREIDAIKEEDMVKYLLDGGRETVPAYVLMPHLSDTDRSWSYYAPSVNAIVKAVEEEYKIDQSRISITGWSVGASSVAAVVSQYPEMFSCAVVMSGYPTSQMDWTYAEAMKKIPVWFLYESESRIRSNAKENSIAAAQAISNAGGSVKTTEVPGVNHETFSIFPDGKTDAYGVIDWLISWSR